MAAINTTQTAFAANEQITSSKLNNILLQSKMDAGALTGDGTLSEVSGQIKVGTLKAENYPALGITAAAIAADAVTTVKILDANVTTAKILDANVTQAKLGTNVVGNGPAFRAYASALTALPTGAFTKVTLGTESFDTNGNFASSTFTPTVAGYYQINATVASATGNAIQFLAILRKNGSNHSAGSGQAIGAAYRSTVSDIVEMNGTTDYLELFAYHTTGSSINTETGTTTTYMSGCLIRSA